MTIEVPANDTRIEFIVSGKSAVEIAEELKVFSGMLEWLAENEGEMGYFFNSKAEAEAMPKVLPIVTYKEWDEDGEYSSNCIVTGYSTMGRGVFPEILPSFAEWARSGKGLDEYCKERMGEKRKGLDEYCKARMQGSIRG